MADRRTAEIQSRFHRGHTYNRRGPSKGKTTIIYNPKEDDDQPVTNIVHQHTHVNQTPKQSMVIDVKTNPNIIGPMVKKYMDDYFEKLDNEKEELTPEFEDVNVLDTQQPMEFGPGSVNFYRDEAVLPGTEAVKDEAAVPDDIEQGPEAVPDDIKQGPEAVPDDIKQGPEAVPDEIEQESQPIKDEEIPEELVQKSQPIRDEALIDLPIVIDVDKEKSKGNEEAVPLQLTDQKNENVKPYVSTKPKTLVVKPAPKVASVQPARSDKNEEEMSCTKKYLCCGACGVECTTDWWKGCCCGILVCGGAALWCTRMDWTKSSASHADENNNKETVITARFL